MFGFVEKLIQAKLAVDRGETPSVTLSLDLSTPEGQRLAALAQRLLIPTTKHHKSGLVTKTGISNPDASQEFFEQVRCAVGDEVFFEVMNNLRQQQALQSKAVTSAAGADLLSGASTTGDAIQSFLSSSPAKDQLSSGQQAKLDNVAEAMKQGKFSLRKEE